MWQAQLYLCIQHGYLIGLLPYLHAGHMYPCVLQSQIHEYLLPKLVPKCSYYTAAGVLIMMCTYERELSDGSTQIIVRV